MTQHSDSVRQRIAVWHDEHNTVALGNLGQQVAMRVLAREGYHVIATKGDLRGVLLDRRAGKFATNVDHLICVSPKRSLVRVNVATTASRRSAGVDRNGNLKCRTPRVGPRDHYGLLDAGQSLPSGRIETHAMVIDVLTMAAQVFDQPRAGKRNAATDVVDVRGDVTAVLAAFPDCPPDPPFAYDAEDYELISQAPSPDARTALSSKATGSKHAQSGRYRHTNSKGVTLYLHQTSVDIGGVRWPIYFFSKVSRNPRGEPCPLPESVFVAEDPRMGSLRVSPMEREEDSHAAHLVVRLIREVSDKMARLVAEDPRALDKMEWRDVERMMAVVLEGLGFDAELTPASKDGGKDIVLRLWTDDGWVTYVVEIKHWRSGKRVGDSAIREFVDVVAREYPDGGLFLSTYGFTSTAFEALTEVERRLLKLGDKMKIVNLCNTYTKIGDGFWQPTDGNLTDLNLSDSLTTDFDCHRRNT
jgi:hypothetical protein